MQGLKVARRVICPTVALAVLIGAAAARADGIDAQSIDRSAVSDFGVVMDSDTELDSVRAFGDDDVDFGEVAIPGTGLTLEDLNLGIGILSGRVHSLGTDPALDSAPHPRILDMVTPKISTRSKSF